MDFSLTTVFVKPVGVANATTGATSALLPGQIGFYNKGYQTPATGASTEFVVAQGRRAGEYPQTTKKSGTIRKTSIVRYRKNVAVTTGVTKQIVISDFTAKCGEEVSITLRAFSKYLNVSYSNGLTHSFMVQTPCCECGDDPCTETDAEDLIDQFVTQINNSVYSDYLTATKDQDDDDNFILVLEGKVLPQDPISASLDNFVYDGYDVVDFFAYAYKNPYTTVDSIADERCDVFATVETTRTPTFVQGSYAEIRQLEKRYYSYQTGAFKTVNCDPDGNPVYVSNAVPGTFYDEFLITFKTLGGNPRWEDALEVDQTVRIFVAVAESAAFTTALNTIIGSASIETEY